MSSEIEPLSKTLADAAFRRAAVEVLRVAKRTGTPIIVWKDGGIVHLSPDDFTEEQLLKPPESPAVPEKAAEDAVDS